jgi:hypothetical protein
VDYREDSQEIRSTKTGGQEIRSSWVKTKRKQEARRSGVLG